MSQPVRLHILNCDPLTPSLIERFGDYPYMFRKLFDAAMADRLAQFSTQHQIQRQLLIDSSDACGPRPTDYESLQTADALLVTGSAASAYDRTDWIVNLESIIRRWSAKEKKLIGICFGHQLIAQALGGDVVKSERGWGVGRRTVPVLSPRAWMGNPAPSSLTLLYSHQDQVIRLPEDAENFLGDAFCPFAGFTIGDHLMTLQGHPEFSVGYVSNLIEKRKQVIGEHKAEQALHDTQLYSVAEAKVAPRWMVDFLFSD